MILCSLWGTKEGIKVPPRARAAEDSGGMIIES